MLELVFSGRVRKGDGRAAMLGCPTANISIEQGGIIPGLGVYAAETEYQDRLYPSLIYISDGRTGADLRLEVHFLDQQMPDLEGQILNVRVLDKLRDIVRWVSDEQIRDMFVHDLQAVRDWFAKRKEQEALQPSS